MATTASPAEPARVSTMSHRLACIVSPTSDASRGQVAMTQRPVTLDDGSVVQAGTIEDAAALCTTSRRPRGCSPATYRAYMKPQRTPVHGRPAPGPIKVTDPVTRDVVTALDPSGRPLYNLGAVRAWNALRGEVGGRVPARETPETLRRTALRAALLDEAAAGRLGRVPLEELRVPRAQGAHPSRVWRHAIAELRSLGLVAERGEGDGAVLALTTAGQTVRDRFRD